MAATMMMRKILAPFVADLKRNVSPPDHYWRSLHYFNLYRLIVSGFFVVSYLVMGSIPVYGADDPRLFFAVSVIYVLFGMLMALAVSVRWPAFIVQLSVQTIGDVAFHRAVDACQRRSEERHRHVAGGGAGGEQPDQQGAAGNVFCRRRRHRRIAGAELPAIRDGGEGRLFSLGHAGHELLRHCRTGAFPRQAGSGERAPGRTEKHRSGEPGPGQRTGDP